MELFCGCFNKSRGQERAEGTFSTLAKSSTQKSSPSSAIEAEEKRESLDVPPLLLEQLQFLSAGQRDTVSTTKGCSEAIGFVQQKFLDEHIESKIARLSGPLHLVESFVGGITTLSQGLGPASSAALIFMGCVKLVLSLGARYIAVIDHMIDCVDDLANTLPRLNDYLGLFPIPKLQVILSTICVECVCFLVSCVKYIERPAVSNFLGLLWSNLDHSLEKTRRNINTLKVEFEHEVQLEYIKTVVNWQRKMEALPSTTPQQHTPLASRQHVLRARNRDFVGRVSILEQLETLFCSNRAASATIHGIGGVGKSSIALEFAHRMKSHFDHVILLHAETELDITNAFAEIARRLGFYDEKRSIEETVERTRNFFDTTDKQCLLIYDNVDETKFLRRYIPENEGYISILITTQRSRVGSEFTSTTIPLGSMNSDEGAKLLFHLSKNTSEDAQQIAQTLSDSLGGLPLALAHYAGYMLRSSMSIEEFYTLFRDHVQDPHIWQGESQTFEDYPKTLESVWSFALSKLSSDARSTLNTLMYLREDAVPELMLLELDNGDEWKSLTKLRQSIMELQDRHLVERTGAGEHAFLRVHTAFKRTIIIRLAQDLGERHRAFDRAVSSVCRGLPRRCLDKGRSGVDLKPLIELFLPHVLSLAREFEAAEPALEGNLDFADMLCDASFYLWEDHLLADALWVAEVGEKICHTILGEEVKTPLHIQLFGLIANLHHTSGRRDKAHGLYQKVIAGREAHIAGLAPEEVSTTDRIDLARALTDFSEWLIDEERLDEAMELSQRALAIYEQLGNHETLPYRFGNQYKTYTLILLGQRKMEEAQRYGRQALEMIVKLYGERYFFTTIFQLQFAMILLSAGKASEALPYFQAVYNVRLDLRGELDSETLEALMWLGVVQYYLGNTKEAETSLEDALSRNRKGNWTGARAARALLWSAIVYSETGRVEIAEEYVAKAQKDVPEILGSVERSAMGHLEVCERAIYCWPYYRSTGAFSLSETPV